MDPLFSVIVPIYQVQKYLEQCVSSILGQSFQDFELILVDDGSEDDSGKICDCFVDKDPKVIVIHKDNGGLVSARIAGSLCAKGQYTVCVDGDDWIENNYLESLAEILRTYQPDVICTGYTVTFPNLKQEKKPLTGSGFYSRKDIENRLFSWMIYNHSGTCFPPTLWAKAFRTDRYRIQQTKVDTQIVLSEDAVCSYPLISQADSLYIIEDCLYNYRKRPESITNSSSPYRWNNPFLVKEMLLRTVHKSFDFREQIYWRMMNSLWTVTASQFHGQYSDAEIENEIRTKLRSEQFSNNIREFPITSSRSLKELVIYISLRYQIVSIMKLYFRTRMTKRPS